MAWKQIGGNQTSKELALVSVPSLLTESEREDLYDNNFSNIAKSGKAVVDILTSPITKVEVTESDNAMREISQSNTAVDSLISDQKPIPSILNSNNAMNVFFKNGYVQTAIGTKNSDSEAYKLIRKDIRGILKFITARAGLDPSNYSDFSDLSSSGPDMNQVASSNSAMEAVSGSVLAKKELASYSNAKQAIATDQNAMKTIGNNLQQDKEDFWTGDWDLYVWVNSGYDSETERSKIKGGLDVTNMSEVVIDIESINGAEIRVGSQIFTSSGTHSINQSGNVKVELYAHVEKNGGTGLEQESLNLNNIYFNR